MASLMQYFFVAAHICLGVAAASYLWNACRKSSRVATWATMFAWMGGIFLLVSMGIRWAISGHAPYSNQFEFATAFTLGVVAMYLYAETRYKLRTLGAVVVPVAFGIITYAQTLPKEVTPLIPALQSDILTIHVAMAVIAYGCFAVAFGSAVLYLLQGDRQPASARSPAAAARPELQLVGVGGGKIESMHLSGASAATAVAAAPAVAVRTERTSGRPYRSWLPSRETLDEIGFHAVTIGFPAQALLLILGAWWGSVAWGRYWAFDPKETAALVTWLIYGVYLHARMSRGLKGTATAWLLITGFGAVLFTYFGNLFLGGLHAYSGL